MSKGFMSQMTRPEEGERGLGASHRRGGTGVASYRRPPAGSHLRNFPEGKRGASATSKAPGAKRKVESMRDKGAKRAANRKLHIDDGCMGGGKGNIPYSKKLFDNIQGIPNFIQYKHNTGFFNTNRVGIFHYLISCEYMYHIHCTSGDHMLVETDGKAERGFTDKNGIPRKGGDWMMIAVPYAVDNYGSKFVNNQYVASLFMHELGHNIGLFEDDPNWGCMKGAFTKKVDYEEGWKVINPSVIQYCRNEET